MQVLYITLLTFFASAVGTLTGFGISTIMIPVLLFFFPLPQTLLLVGVVHWFDDIWKLVLFRQGLRWGLIAGFGGVGVVATWLAANIVFTVPEQVLSRILGGFLLAYVVFIIAKPSFKIPRRPASAVAGGGLSGFLAGIFGVGGAVRSVFLLAFDLPKAVYIATAGAIAFFIDTTRVSAYILNNTRLGAELLWGFAFYVPASFLGAALAKKVVDRIPQKYFRRVIAVFIFLAGLKFLVFPG